jgi:nicotinamidase/pyrazinamidase
LVIVDVQNDFLPGGKLAVAEGDKIIPALNRYIALFQQNQLPIFATRDWHPADHCSFKSQGGPWPAHCVAETPGAQFPQSLALPPSATIISKGTSARKEAYSGFEGTKLESLLRDAAVDVLYVGGLATDYCVLNTVKDGLRLGFAVVLLTEAMRAVEVHPGDGARAELEMLSGGATRSGNAESLEGDPL